MKEIEKRLGKEEVNSHHDRIKLQPLLSVDQMAEQKQVVAEVDWISQEVVKVLIPLHPL
jgi:hypothetical protein